MPEMLLTISATAAYTLLGTRSAIVGFRALRKNGETRPTASLVAFITFILWPVLAVMIGFVAMMGGGAGAFESKR